VITVCFDPEGRVDWVVPLNVPGLVEKGTGTRYRGTAVEGQAARRRM